MGNSVTSKAIGEGTI